MYLGLTFVLLSLKKGREATVHFPRFRFLLLGYIVGIVVVRLPTFPVGIMFEC